MHPHFSVWPFAVGICVNSLPSFCSFSSNWALDLVSSLHVPVVKVCPVFPPSCPVSSSSMCPVPELSYPPQPPSPCAAAGLVPWKCSLKSARPPSPHSDLGTMSALLGGRGQRCQPWFTVLLPCSHQDVVTKATWALGGCRHGAIPAQPKFPGDQGKKMETEANS